MTTPGHSLECQENKTLVIRYMGDGDVVQFKMFEGLHQGLKKLQDGVFEAKVEVPNCDEAIFSYQIIVHKTDKDGKMIELPYGKPTQNSDRLMWHGKERENPHLPHEKLDGKVVDTLVFSPSLNAKRGITVYWPKQFGKDTPIIYFTDGSVVKGYAKYVDRLIAEKKTRPVIMVGVHSSETVRYEEYVASNEDTAAFKRHERFFFYEIMRDFEANIPDWQGDRYMYGFSNGAAFCMYAGLYKPDVFEAIIAYSTADYISEFAHSIDIDSNKKYPRFYMGAGRFEANIFKVNLKFVQKMKTNNIQVDFKEFISGHDFQVWREEFLGWLEMEMK